MKKITVMEYFLHFLKEYGIYEQVINVYMRRNFTLKTLYKNVTINPFPYIYNKNLNNAEREWMKRLMERKRKLFIQFLEENNIKKLFEKELTKFSPHIPNVESYAKNVSYSFFLNAFNWNDTLQGERYWKNKANEWGFYLNHKNTFFSEW